MKGEQGCRWIIYYTASRYLSNAYGTIFKKVKDEWRFVRKVVIADDCFMKHLEMV